MNLYSFTIGVCIIIIFSHTEWMRGYITRQSQEHMLNYRIPVLNESTVSFCNKYHVLIKKVLNHTIHIRKDAKVGKIACQNY